MKRFVIRLVLVMLASSLAVLVAVGIAVQSLQPKTYKAELLAVLEQYIGRPVMSQGDIQPVFFPVIGFRIDGLRSLDDALFGATPFIQIEETVFGLSLPSLFQGKLVFDTIGLHGLSLHLMTAANGESNWRQHPHMLAEAQRNALGVTQLGSASIQVPPQVQSTQKKAAHMAIDTVRCTNARIQYQDVPSGSALSLVADHADLAGLTTKTRWVVESKGYLEGVHNSLGAEFSLQAFLEPGQTSDTGIQMTLGSLHLAAAKGTSKGLGSPGIVLELQGSGRLVPPQHVMHIDSLLVRQGQEAWLRLQGRMLLPGHDSLPAKVRLGLEGILQGSVIDLDTLEKAFTVPQGTIDAFSQPGTPEAFASLQSRGAKDDSYVVGPSPLAWARELQVVLDTQLAGLVYKGLTWGQVLSSLRLQQAVFSLDSLQAQLLGGTLTGTVKADGAQHTIAWHAKASWKEVQLAKAGLAALPSGSVGGKVELTARGNDWQRFVNSLRGQGSLALAQGMMVLPAHTAQDVLALAPQGAGIPITSGAASFRLQKGQARVQEITLAAPMARATGTAIFAYDSQRLEGRLTVDIPEKKRTLPVVFSLGWPDWSWTCTVRGASAPDGR